MKHLRKYNEDVNQNFEFDEEYIKECFIEFFDDPKYDVYVEEEVSFLYSEYCIAINCTDLEPLIYYNVDNFIKMAEELVDFYKEIEVCIEKVKIKYPDVDVILYQDNFTKDQGTLSGTRFVWIKFRYNNKDIILGTK